MGEEEKRNGEELPEDDFAFEAAMPGEDEEEMDESDLAAAQAWLEQARELVAEEVANLQAELARIDDKLEKAVDEYETQNPGNYTERANLEIKLVYIEIEKLVAIKKIFKAIIEIHIGLEQALLKRLQAEAKFRKALAEARKQLADGEANAAKNAADADAAGKKAQADLQAARKKFAAERSALLAQRLADLAQAQVDAKAAMVASLERSAMAEDESAGTLKEKVLTMKEELEKEIKPPDEPTTDQPPDEPTTDQPPDEPTTDQPPDEPTDDTRGAQSRLPRGTD